VGIVCAKLECAKLPYNKFVHQKQPFIELALNKLVRTKLDVVSQCVTSYCTMQGVVS
jgi:hypothetical protein